MPLGALKARSVHVEHTPLGKIIQVTLGPSHYDTRHEAPVLRHSAAYIHMDTRRIGSRTQHSITGNRWAVVCRGTTEYLMFASALMDGEHGQGVENGLLRTHHARVAAVGTAHDLPFGLPTQ